MPESARALQQCGDADIADSRGMPGEGRGGQKWPEQIRPPECQGGEKKSVTFVPRNSARAAGGERERPLKGKERLKRWDGEGGLLSALWEIYKRHAFPPPLVFYPTTKAKMSPPPPPS